MRFLATTQKGRLAMLLVLFAVSVGGCAQVEYESCEDDSDCPRGWTCDSCCLGIEGGESAEDFAKDFPHPRCGGSIPSICEETRLNPILVRACVTRSSDAATYFQMRKSTIFIAIVLLFCTGVLAILIRRNA